MLLTLILEVEITDPHRLFLECAWSALLAMTPKGAIELVYAGASLNNYLSL